MASAWRLAFALACLVPLVASAADAQLAGIENVRFRTYSTRDGLPQATARAIAQDSAGFLWIGTQDGLARFDGYDFRVYRHDHTDAWSLSDSHVVQLVADDDGGLWIGTAAGGLDHYDPDLDRFTTLRADPARSGALASNSINALLLDRGHRLWIASSGGRLQWLDRASGTLHDATFGERTPLRDVRSMIELADGNLLLGTLDGLWRADVDAGTLRELRADPASALDVYALAQGADGSLWAGTAEDGLYRFSAAGALLAHYRNTPDGDPTTTLHDDAVRALLFDREGMLWIAGNARGLARMDVATGHFDRYPHAPARSDSVAANRLWCLFEDRHGLLLVGSWVNGFSIHDPRTRAFAQIDSVPGDARTLPARPVINVYADADGTVWMGVIEGGGLVHFDPARGVLQRYTHDPARPDSLAHDFVRYITRSRDGSLWVATAGGGLDRLAPGASGFEHTRHDPDDPDSLASDTLLSVYEDSRGTLWVGTFDRGLDERCAGCRGFRHHVHDPSDPASLSDNGVNRVLETRDGGLWIAARTGLQRYDRAKGTFEHFRAREGDSSSLSSDLLTTLTEDSRGELWIGTQGGGVDHVLRGTDGALRFDTIDSHDGLASDAIGSIIEDDAGDLWVSTTVGISRIRRDGGSVANFGALDGAQELGYWVNSGARLPDGRIVFGGLGGATLFDPRAVVPPPEPQPVVTRLLLQNVPAPLRWRDPLSPLTAPLARGRKLELGHDQASVTFEFSALEFAAPDSIRYAYRLIGHDRGWIDTAANRRLATYTDLAPGHYAFEVRARHDGGAWSVLPARVEVRVNPAAWASTGAYAAYLLAALAIGLLATLQVRASLRRRRTVQEAVRLSEERLKLALWGSGSELWDIDLATGSLHRDNKLEHLAATHEAATQTLAGYQPFVHPDDLARFEGALSDHVRGRTPAFEASYRTRDRSHAWVWILTRGRVVERDEQGRALRMSGTNSDIDALKQALDALRTLNEQLETRVGQRTAALEDINAELRSTLERLTLAQRQLVEAEKLASLGGMVAGIAHEINTPLGIGVTAASHLHEEARRLSLLLARGDLRDADLQRFERSARESSDLILRNLQRADRLVKSFKQVAVDQSSEDRRVVDLRICLEEILTTLGPTLRKTPHRAYIDCEPGLVLETAPGALYQIITNLVMNSLTHGFDEGTAGTIRIAGARVDGDGVAIDYADDGRGMDEPVRARVFEPFFTTRRGQGGSGLGMNIVYSLVTQVLQGTIACESAPGAGTRFRIRFRSESLRQRA